MTLELLLMIAIAGAPQEFDPLKFVEPGKNNLAWAPTPHFNERPEGTRVDTIVLHHTASSTLTSVVRWFAAEESKVSAHFTIGKDGSIVQHVNTFFRAWHAGTSSMGDGRTNVNNFSVGIEIVNKGDGSEPYPPDQVEAVHHLVAHLCRHRYRRQIKQIVSHEFIADPAGRKNDPIDYPWDSLRPLADELEIKLIYGRKDRQPKN